MDSIYEQEQVLAGIDEIKLQMLKLVMMYETSLDPLEKQIVRSSLPSKSMKFSKFIKENLVKPINETQDKIKQQLANSENSSNE